MKKIFIILVTLFGAVLTAIGQDVIVLKDGNVIKAYNIEIGKSSTYYQLNQEDNAPILKISNIDILVIRYQDGSHAIFSEDVSSAESSTSGKETHQLASFPNIDLTDYHGYLLAKDNCVYLATTTDADYELAGLKGMRQAITEQDYWKIVDTPEQAHFVMQYFLETRGLDSCYILVRTRESYLGSRDPGHNFKGRFSTNGTFSTGDGSFVRESDIDGNFTSAYFGMEGVIRNMEKFETKEIANYFKTGKAKLSSSPIFYTRDTDKFKSCFIR